MPVARTNDSVALSYKTNGSGRCHLLLIHNWSGSGADFNEVMKYLDFTNLRAITYDLRGHGNSDQPDMGYTLQRFAQDAFDVVDHAGAAKVIVIGFGIGAKLAQYVATLHPERIRGLILIAGCPASTVQLSNEMQQDWIGSAGNRDKLMALKQQAVHVGVKSELFNRWADDAAKIPQHILTDTMRMATETSFTDRLELVHCPVMIIGGLHDPIFTPDILRKDVAEPLGNARLVFLNCGHEIPLEQPLELASCILAFLAGMNAVPLLHKMMT